MEKIRHRLSYPVAQETFGLLHPIALLPLGFVISLPFYLINYMILRGMKLVLLKSVTMCTDLFGDSSVKRIHIVYVFHVLVAYHLTGVQVGTFIGKNDYCGN